jgi:hypothetical protein
MFAQRTLAWSVPLLIAGLLGGCNQRDALGPTPSYLTVSGPTGLTPTAVSPYQIDLAWQDNSSHESGFELYRSTSGAGGAFTLLATTGPDITAQSDPGLTPSSLYCYKVRSFQVTGRNTTFSSFSSTACATTPSLPPPPGPPGAPSYAWAGAEGSTVIVVDWADTSSNEDGFRVERSLDAGASWTLAGTVPAGTVADGIVRFADYGLPSEQPICYRVIAFNSQGDSPPTLTNCLTLVLAPTDLTATLNAQGEYDLTWTDNSSIEDGYEVWVMDISGPAYGGLIATLPANSTGLSGLGCEPTTWCWGFAVVATKDGVYSDFAGVVTRQP